MAERIPGPPTSPVPVLSLSDQLRFWAKVDKSGDCWVWTAATTKGYGCFSIGPLVTAKRYLAHRISYALAYGQIPPRLTVSHLCHNPPCVNPSHLVAETHKLNVQRSGQGVKHHQAKLTDDDVRSIRRLAGQGRSHYAIADQFGVTQSNIWRIAKGLTWKHLED